MNRSKSAELYAKAKTIIPGGTSSSGRNLDYPFFIDRGKGSRIWDVDGNEFIDYVCAWGPLTLGHAPDCVNDAIREQLDKGLQHGGTGVEREYELAKLLVDLVPSVEQVRFGTTGSEVVHIALRLARAFTGKEKVVKFEGHFHGTISDIYQSVYPTAPYGPDHAPYTKRSVDGQQRSDEENVIVQPFNNLDVVEETMKKRNHEIAALIVEPIGAYSGVQPPVDGFLEGLRRITSEYGVLLIFDEVVTGFRMAIGGAQEYFGVTPDITVMAKGFGCGVPIAAFGGRKEIMDKITDGSMPHYGTYNANALCLAGALAGLLELSKDNAAAIRSMHDQGKKLRNGFNEMFDKYDVPLFAHGVDPLFTVVGQEKKELCMNYRDYQSRDYDFARRWRDAMFDSGSWSLYRGTFVLSAAHTDEDIDTTLKTCEEIMADGEWKNRELHVPT